MSVWVWGLGVVWLALIAYIAEALRVGRFHRRFVVPRPGPDRGPPAAGRGAAAGDWPAVEILIPARNEAHAITDCLEAVLAQDYPNFTVVLIDDRSDDQTSEIARRFAARDERISVKRIDKLPRNWLGKAHALAIASRASKTPWLLFLDTDVRLDPWGLRGAMTEALARDVELLSLWPRLEGGSFWDQAVGPHCGLQIAIWHRPSGTNSPKSPVVLASGQFLLIQREAYRRIGGHEAVRDYLAEDLALAANAKRAGLSVYVALGENLESVRMYQSLAQLVSGYSRAFFCTIRRPERIAMTIGLNATFLWPFAAGVLLISVFFSGLVDLSGSDPDALLNRLEFFVLVALCLIHLVEHALFARFLWRRARAGNGWFLFYPFAILVTFLPLIDALVFAIRGRQYVWAGTTYPIDRHGRLIMSGGVDAQETAPNAPAGTTRPR